VRLCLIRTAGDEASALLGTGTLLARVVNAWVRTIAVAAHRIEVWWWEPYHKPIMIGTTVAGILFVVLYYQGLRGIPLFAFGGLIVIPSFMGLLSNLVDLFLVPLCPWVLIPIWVVLGSTAQVPYLNALGVAHLAILAGLIVVFGPELALAVPLVRFSFEPAPPGAWNSEVFRPHASALHHSDAYRDPAVLQRIVEWIAAQPDPVQEFLADHDELPAGHIERRRADEWQKLTERRRSESGRPDSAE
jgi:hypothetical protein